jgi:heme exporter protein D
MRQVRARRAEIGISLFPFLAVLICTMGALIVLLVLVVHQARVQADTVNDELAEQAREERLAQQRREEQEEEDYLWKAQILKQQRSELTERLSDGRLQLGHLEDHIRRLERRLQQLQAEWAEQPSDGLDGDEDRTASLDELSRLQDLLDSQRQRLADAQRELAKRQQSFSIIPYDGPHGTRRRPIYIECRESGIIIQPEGIVLGPQDLAGPLGPGNPLDASLRAIREFWDRTAGESKLGEPYPLLIVRSDGAVAYARARAAMANWDDQFGYELVDSDMPLDFPTPDPALRDVLQTAVATARQRQAMLAAAMPRRFAAPPPESFRLAESENGWADAGEGWADAGEGWGDAGEGRGDAPARRTDRGVGSHGRDGGTSQAMASRARGLGTGNLSGPAATRPVTATGSAAAMAQTTSGSHGMPEAFSDNVGHGSAREGSSPGGAEFRAAGTGSGPGGLAGQHALSSSYAAGPAGSPHGSPAAGPPGSNTAGHQASAGGGPISSEQGGARQDAGGAQAGSGGQAGPNLGAVGGAAGSAGDDPASHATPPPCPDSLPESIARQRGANWALPPTAFNSTGITRPVHVELHHDRLIILPDRGDHRDPQTFPVQGAMRRSIQPFVSGVWGHTERWGMAVAGGYWKPVIRVQVAPDAHHRLRELETLMQDSGIEVEPR